MGVGREHASQYFTREGSRQKFVCSFLVFALTYLTVSNGEIDAFLPD